MSRPEQTGVELFISYSHENAAWFKKLRPLIKFRGRHRAAHAWHDQELKAGDRWHEEIKAALDDMHVFVCLVSQDMLASDYIMDVELPVALERAEANEVEIVPVLLYDIDLDEECPELKPFQPVPAFDKCWRDFERGGDHRDAHKPIRKGIRDAVKKAQQRAART